MSDSDITNLPPAILGDLYEEAATRNKETKAALTILDNAVMAKYNVRIEAAYTTKGEQTGAINFDDDDCKIKIDRPKRTSWDETILSEIETQLKENAWTVSDFITTKMSVSENVFNTMASPFKEMFIPARTVKSGKPSIKIEPKGDA